MSGDEKSIRSLFVTRWVIYSLMAIVVVLPYIVHMPLKFKPSPDAEALFDRVDRLEPNSHVLIAFDFDPSSQAELRPMARAILLHCFHKGLVPIVMTFWPGGLNMDKEIIEQAAAEFAEKWGKPVQKGKDYVFLGFRPGDVNLILNMGVDFKGQFEKDFYGLPTAAMPGLQGVNSLKDINLAVDLAAGATIQMWIVYGSDKYGFPLGAGSTAVQTPDLYPFRNSGQIVGILGGLRGGADYEVLLSGELPKAEADAVRGMQAQSATHVLMIIMLVGANVWMLVVRARRRKDSRYA